MLPNLTTSRELWWVLSYVDTTCGHLWSPVVNVGVWSERHEEEASTGQHHHTAGVLSLLQDLLEVLVVHLNTRRTTGSSDLREEHEGELPLGDPQPARLPVLQLQVEVEVQLEGSGARLGRNSIKSFNHPSLTSPPSSLSPDRIRVPPDRHINSVYCCKTCLVRLTISPSLSK